MEHNVGYLVKTGRAVSNLKFWVWLPQPQPVECRYQYHVFTFRPRRGEPLRASIEISPRRSYYKKRLSLFCGRSCHWRWRPGPNVTLQWDSPTKYSPATLSLLHCPAAGLIIWLQFDEFVVSSAEIFGSLGTHQPGSVIVFTWLQLDKLEAGKWSLWNFFQESVLKVWTSY